MIKQRVTLTQAIKASPVGATVAKMNPSMPIDTGTGGWVLYGYDRKRRAWSYYLCARDEATLKEVFNV